MKIQLVSIFLAVFISAGCARDAKKIISGNRALITEVPHQVSLQTPGGGSFCGGTIIDSTHILTAAHCIVDKNLELNEFIKNGAQVVTGVHDKLIRTRYNVFNVISYVRHSDYRPAQNYMNDIAVLKLDRPIPFNAYQRPAQLPTSETPLFTRVLSTGWGNTGYNLQKEEGEGDPQYLLKVEGIVIDSGECSRALNTPIYPGQICVRSGAHAGTCFGDSGGPLSHGHEIVGVVSWGRPCGQGFPDVYTRVSHYLDFIRSAISQ